MISIIRSSPKFLSKKKIQNCLGETCSTCFQITKSIFVFEFHLIFVNQEKEVKKTKQDLRLAKFAFAFGWFGYTFASRLKVRSGQSRRHGGAVFCQLFGLSIWDVLEDGALN